MTCRNDPGDPRRCERCGAFLWVAEEGLFCGECGVLMPCTMRVLPLPETAEARRDAGATRARTADRGRRAERAPGDAASRTALTQ